MLSLRRCILFIDRGHWLMLLVAAPLMLFPAPARTPLLLVVPVVWAIGWIARPRAPLPSTPLNAVLLVLMVMVLVSVVVTPDLAFSLPKVAGMVLAIGAYFAVAREARKPVGLWLCVLALLGVGAGVAVLALVGTTWGAKISFLSVITARLAPRLMGLAGAEEGFNPNQVAGALLWVTPLFLCLPVGLATMQRHRGAPTRLGARVWRGMLIVMATLAALAMVGVLVLTQSRGAYIAFALGLMGIVFLALPRRGRWVMVIMLVIALAAASVIVWQRRDTIAPLVGLRIDAAGVTSVDTAADGLSTLDGRLEIWSRALYGIEDFPFTGMGMNSFRKVVHLLYPLFLTSPDTDIAHAHNEFLQAALDLGIPGMIAFGALYLVGLWMLWRIWVARAGDGLTRSLALGLGGGLFTHLVYGMTDAVALGAKPGILFWMLLGLISGLFAQSNGAVAIGQAARRVPGVTANHE